MSIFCLELVSFNFNTRGETNRLLLISRTSRHAIARSPLVLKLKLTNSRQKMLIYPGEPERIAKLIVSLRKNSRFATFDGVSYHDYWSWNNLSGTDDGLAGGLNKEKSSGLTNPPNSPNPPAGPPVRMLSPEDEDEVERLYQKLKTVGRLDSRSTESSKSPDED
jgi:hypothetical protein